MKQQKRLQRQKEQAHQLYSSFSFNTQQLSFKQDSVTTATTYPPNCINTNPLVMSNDDSLHGYELNDYCGDFDQNGHCDGDGRTQKRPALKISPNIVLNSCTSTNSELSSECYNNVLIGNNSKRSTTFTTANLHLLRDQQFSQTLQINNQIRQLNARNIGNRCYGSRNSSHLQITSHSNPKRRPRSTHYHPVRCISPNLDNSLQPAGYEMLDPANKKSVKLHSSAVPQVIVLGPPSSGKTSLISRFNYFLTVQDFTIIHLLLIRAATHKLI